MCQLLRQRGSKVTLENGICLVDMGGEVTVAYKIFGVRGVGFADWENHFALECSFGVIARYVVGPYFLRQTECCPGFRPSGIKGNVSDDFGSFGAGDAIFLCVLKMMHQRAVGDSLADESRHRHERAVAQRQKVVAAPYFSEKNVIVEMREFRCELAEDVVSGGLYYFLLCHNIKYE